MGSRADFYVGRGKEAEWLGSIAWDGYPEGIPDTILDSQNETFYRTAVQEFVTGKRDGRLPENGWPWAWDDSRTTDFAYAYDDGKVWASCFGSEWFNPRQKDIDPYDSKQAAVFPNMSKIKNVTDSGFILIGLPDKQKQENAL